MNQTRLLGGRYQLGELLGYGGMAEVHRGRDQRLGRDVAVKVLRADLARDPNFQARFRREAQNAAALNHPAIVAVYDTGEDETPDGILPYIVMEYVEGRTLKEVMQDEGYLMPRRALEIVADVCSALDFSHRHGIVHRDIKPGNVMLTRNGSVKVMDFGIARAVASATATMTQTSAVIGTAQYLSPEQARGETVDARSDVYSTGCLLYELLVGNPPFTGDNPVSVAYQHVREDPVPPSEVNRDVNPSMDAVVLKAMAKNPANRYQSAGEMRTDLLRAAAGRPVSAPAVLSSEERTQLLPRAAGAAVVPNDRYDNQDDYGYSEDRKKSKKVLIWTLVIIGLIAVFAAVAYATSHILQSNTPQVSVPNVVGENAAQARDRITAVGLTTKTETITSSAADKGKVVSQSPQGGTEVDRNSEVKLRVGGGPETVQVPNLDGLSQEQAEARLTDVGLKPVSEEVDSSVEAGTVVRYTPGAGTTVSKGDEVTLQISRGNLKAVPKVIGMFVDSAVAELESAGLDADVREREDATQPEGTVIDQNPKEGKEVAEGTRVIIWVAKSPEVTTPPPTTTSAPPTIFPPPGGGSSTPSPKALPR